MFLVNPRLNFRYSTSPMDDDGTGGEATGTSYGTLTATLHS